MMLQTLWGITDAAHAVSKLTIMFFPVGALSLHAVSALIANVYWGISDCRINGAKLASRGFARVALTRDLGPVGR